MWELVPAEALDPLFGCFQIEIVCSGPVFYTFVLPFASWKALGERCIVSRWMALQSFLLFGHFILGLLKIPSNLCFSLQKLQIIMS